ncbi:hypothetical protein DAPPUDRAFT_250980 [Daphnia pulex]|uniref:Replication protein A OB domain-containing protein n=1 Tax=Daphnia pulex TaxID=6669 RepID=E9GZJ0_DAPPU|nr:hypothetical protein DAPPUDRAFT_250980 [Daphnia pulex]|eukprot:EFX75000.1 hypothetical protein DAPPUDRAFT_250980 [Daphnia pulex]
MFYDNFKIHEVDVEEAGTCLEEEIPFYKHHFTALDKCQESGKIIEVIGGLYEIGEIITIKTAKASTKREIKIIDQSYNKPICLQVTITMWNTIAEKFIIAVEKLEVVVAFAGIKISTFSREDGEIFLDSFHDTLVSINPDIPESAELKRWLKQQ